MCEAELHVLRARLDGGIRNKAARGELRRGLPVGLVWGEDDGRDPAAPRRGRHRRHRRGLRPVRRVRVGARDLAVAARAGPALAAAAAATCAAAPEITWVEPDLPRGPHHADPSRLRRRLRLRPAPASERYVDETACVRQRSRRLPPRRVGGAHHRASPRVHRLGHLPGQPGPHRRQHPPAAHTSRAPARCGKAARCCKAWPPAGAAAASSPSSTGGPAKSTPRLLLHRHRPSWSRAAASGT